jgi:hypothetical protein
LHSNKKLIILIILFYIAKIKYTNIIVIIFAHFLGCIFGVAVFSFIFPFAPLYVFQPLDYSDGSSDIYGLIIETVVVCLYTCIIIALPELLKINKLSPYLVSVPIVPLIYYGVPSEFNPAASFALWYIDSRSNINDNINDVISHDTNETIIVQLLRGQNNAILEFISVIHKEHIIGPIIAAVMAGLICTIYFPEDSSSRKIKIIKLK